MSTIAEFATVVKKTPQQVLELCNQAGLGKTGEDDTLSEEDKIRLRRYILVGGQKKLNTGTSSGPVELPRSGGGRNTVTVKHKGRRRKTPPSPLSPSEDPDKETAQPEAGTEPPEAGGETAQTSTTPPEEPAPRETSPEEKQSEKSPEPETPPRRGQKAEPGKHPSPSQRKGRQAAKQDRKQQRGRLEIEEGHDGRRRRRIKKPAPVKVTKRNEFERPANPVAREVLISGDIQVVKLAQAMAVKASEVLSVLESMGKEVALEDSVTPELAELVVETLEHKAVRVQAEDEEGELERLSVLKGEPQPRPPVVTVMGHVDHGKTSLLDCIRDTRVVAGEAGGITQHIGAYQVQTGHGHITFLDTPGHAAFTAMRARGANCTDIIVLVVAADDGVKPQTEEAVRHARVAEVPIIVAVNKMDRPQADLEQVRTGLMALEVQDEAWGGDTVFVPVSAKTGDGIEALLETISLQAEMLELKAQTEGMARGVVVESSLDRGRGVVATVLVQAGCLKPRDLILCGEESGRVRVMLNDVGKQVKQAGPSVPVQLLGLSKVPQAGDLMHVLKDETKVREIAELRKQRTDTLNGGSRQQRSPNFDWPEKMDANGMATLDIILKADVRGSAEALREALGVLSTEEAEVNILHVGIGGINQSDTSLAETSGGVLLGFNVRADTAARRMISERGLEFRHYSVIYELIDDVRRMLEQQLQPEVHEEMVGMAEVLKVYSSSKMGTVAGCRVTEGSMLRGYPIRVLRDAVVIYEGELESLRRHKDDVTEVASGTECGIAVAKYNDVQVRDQIEVYRRVETARTL